MITGGATWDLLESVHKWTTRAVIAVVLASVVYFVAGCASLKSAAAPAGGAAGGAAVGSMLGPGGAIGGAAIGAVVGDSLEENDSLRSGETVGEGALDDQIKRWRVRAIQADQAASLAEQSVDWFKAIMLWSTAGLALWFLWRNRLNLKDLGFVRGLLHAVMGGTIGRKAR